MARAVHNHLVDVDGLAEVLRAREDLVLEEALGPREFGLVEGPFHEYRRVVELGPATDGRHEVTETTEFRLAIPVFGWLFVAPVKSALRHRRPAGSVPWWSPPDRFSTRASNVLGLLCGLSVVTAYLGTLLSQTITFAADEFGASDTAQGATLAAVRVGVLFSLVLVALSDRRGRRKMLVVSLYLGCVAAATTAAAPNLIGFGVSQTLARGFSITAGVLIGIIAAEEMPAGSRAYAVSVLGMSGALGAGLVLWLLPVADLGESAWRLVFVASLPLMLVVRALGRRLPESKRFVMAARTELDDLATKQPESRRAHRRRLALLGVSGLLTQVFFAPASQFFNEFLRDERHFSAARITAFQILTNLPGGIGVVVGGKLADTRGRRIVGSVGLIGGVGATVLMYNAFGVSMWFWSVIGALLGAAVLPALGVYGPELFPTTMRGRANSLLTLLGVVGSVSGLLLAGWLSDRLDGLGPTIMVLGAAPAFVAFLVLALYPETAHRELEELNPEDAVLTDLTDAADSPQGGAT